ncbi:MAG: ThiF family adenylyltransferase, partial [Promethearchaeota archaeon]
MVFRKETMLHWNDHYINQTERNIGYITYTEQERLRKTPIGVFGVGGIGGPLAEQLVRSGCERITICDFDTFDETNLNRQICTMDDIGDYKVNVLENYLKKINPEVKIQKYSNVTEEKTVEMIKNIDVAALSLDGPIASIIIARECQVQ